MHRSEPNQKQQLQAEIMALASTRDYRFWSLRELVRKANCKWRKCHAVIVHNWIPFRNKRTQPHRLSPVNISIYFLVFSTCGRSSFCHQHFRSHHKFFVIIVIILNNFCAFKHGIQIIYFHCDKCFHTFHINTTNSQYWNVKLKPANCYRYVVSINSERWINSFFSLIKPLCNRCILFNSVQQSWYFISAKMLSIILLNCYIFSLVLFWLQ